MVTVVVGAGIIGTAIAHDLQKRGRKVVLLDRDAPGKGASYGNMASIAVTEFLPALRPPVWKQIPGWMLDSEGRVRVRCAGLSPVEGDGKTRAKPCPTWPARP
jgi:D-amino-acid dehydrogenase